MTTDDKKLAPSMHLHTGALSENKQISGTCIYWHGFYLQENPGKLDAGKLDAALSHSESENNTNFIIEMHPSFWIT